MPRADVLQAANSRAEESDEFPEASFIPLFDVIPADRCIPTGCTILNLVASGRVDGGWLMGRIARVMGGSDTGKTLLCLSTSAEVAEDARFSNYDLYFDDAEASNEFNLVQWGKLNSRLKAPGEEASYYLEELYSRLSKLLERQVPFVYTIDSMDALETMQSEELFRTHQKELEQGKDELSGSYGDGKAKLNSQHLRKIKSSLKKTGSVVLMISQVRDSMQQGSFADAQTTAGGRALKYYACYQVWLSKIQDMFRTIDGKPRKVGTLVRVRVDKNHATGKHMDFDMPMYYGWGIDDERCSIRWLIEQGVWKKDGQSVSTREFVGKVTEKELADLLRKDPVKKTAFMQLLQSAWDDLESKVRLPCRYSGEAFNENDAD